jgi:hypothetical protein
LDVLLAWRSYKNRASGTDIWLPSPMGAAGAGLCPCDEGETSEA